MKKSILLLFGLAIMLTLFQNQSANAAKKSTIIKSSVSTTKSKSNLKFFDLAVGGINDPNNSSILYVMFGNSAGSNLTIVKVYINGVLQTGTGVTISGSYTQLGIGKYLVTGTITRADHTSFSCNGSYDTN